MDVNACWFESFGDFNLWKVYTQVTTMDLAFPLHGLPMRGHIILEGESMVVMSKTEKTPLHTSSLFRGSPTCVFVLRTSLFVTYFHLRTHWGRFFFSFGFSSFYFSTTSLLFHAVNLRPINWTDPFGLRLVLGCFLPDTLLWKKKKQYALIQPTLTLQNKNGCFIPYVQSYLI